jgi:hypothetical protein
MSGQYEPNLLDVAKLLYATSGEGPAPEAVSLVNWLIERVPEVQDLWQSVNQPLEGSVSFLDLMELHFCLHNEQESDRAHGMAVWLLRRLPETARLWNQLEQMGYDAGCLLQYPAYGVDVVKYNRDVDRLLATEWKTAEEALDATGEVGTSYNEWLGIVEARLARGEGDAERLREVRGRLRAEAALARQQPLLEDKLPMLFEVVTAGKNRSRLAEALDELARALRDDEPATLAQALS